jgi:sugar O-acyltransferase (sialic acid O-acetyltransferase NeuD family)
MKNIVVFGCGLHANCCIDAIEREGKYNIVGIIDSINPVGLEIYGYEIIGRQEDLIKLIKDYRIDGGVIGIGDNWSRKIVYDCVINLVPNFEFVNVIHPSVIIGKNTKLGKGVVILAGCIIVNDCIIGDFCLFLTGAQLDHNSVMHDFASISAGSITGGKVNIGKYSAITLGVTIMDRITIGQNTVVGSGSLVVKNLPDNVLAYGSPAKIIRTRDSGEKILKSL